MTGAQEVLDDITYAQLGMKAADFENLVVFVAGDQLTVDRIRKLKIYKTKDETAYDSCSPWEEWIQLFHKKMGSVRCVFGTHWSAITGKDTPGLYQDCQTLGRTKINPDKLDFYPHHDLINDTFETLCLGILK